MTQGFLLSIDSGSFSDLLGGCVVSNAQYAEVVSVTVSFPHLMTSRLAVNSNNGGRGKLCTLSFALAAMIVAADSASGSILNEDEDLRNE